MTGSCSPQSRAGAVEQVNGKGVKVLGEWLNVSQCHPSTPMPTAGAPVHVQAADADRGAWIKSLKILGHAAPSPTPALDCYRQIRRQTRWLQRTRGGIPVGLDARAKALMRCPPDSGSSGKPDCVARLSRHHWRGCRGTTCSPTGPAIIDARDLYIDAEKTGLDSRSRRVTKPRGQTSGPLPRRGEGDGVAHAASPLRQVLGIASWA